MRLIWAGYVSSPRICGFFPDMRIVSAGYVTALTSDRRICRSQLPNIRRNCPDMRIIPNGFTSYHKIRELSWVMGVFYRYASYCDWICVFIIRYAAYQRRIGRWLRWYAGGLCCLCDDLRWIFEYLQPNMPLVSGYARSNGLYANYQQLLRGLSASTLIITR
jgi:hypothetical protein